MSKYEEMMALFVEQPEDVAKLRRSAPIYARIQVPMMACLITLGKRISATEFVGEAVAKLILEYASRPGAEYDRWRTMLATYLAEGEGALPGGVEEGGG